MAKNKSYILSNVEAWPYNKHDMKFWQQWTITIKRAYNMEVLKVPLNILKLSLA